ncbi:MAG: GIY-YIG nuclease family protein [Nitrosopumilaceae archaeon]
MEILKEKVQLWLDSARFVKAKSGIYILYDRKLNPIYIGESDNLQSQFSKYLDTDFENNTCKQKTYTYQRTFTENHKEQKKILLEQFKAEYGLLPCCNDSSSKVGN